MGCDQAGASRSAPLEVGDLSATLSCSPLQRLDFIHPKIPLRPQGRV